MGGWRRLIRGVRSLVNPAAADREADEEIRHYFAEAETDLRNAGLSADAARREVRARFGDAHAVREQVRESGWEQMFSSLAADVRYGSRRLRREWGFALVTTATLALGIGAATAIFSAVDPILLEPLPYPDPARLVAVIEAHDNGSRSDGTFAMFREFQTRTHAFAALAVIRVWRPTISGTGEPQRLEGERVSAEYFRVLGVHPRIGRDFTAGDDRPRAPLVAILSDDAWQRTFGADPGIVGRAIRLDDTLYAVVGVMPAGFENVLAPKTSVWTTLQYDPSLPADGREWGHHLRTVARLRPGVSVARATADVSAVGHALVASGHHETYDPHTLFAVTSLQDLLTHDVRPVLFAIVGAVLLVLVIACVNVANLILARGLHRGPEFALRTALGAGRSRLARQLVTESLLLAGLGGVAGIGVAAATLRTLVALAPPGLPRADAIHVDARMLGAGMLLTIVIGLAFGLLPSVRAGRSDLQHEMARGSARAAGGRAGMRAALVIAQVALAVILLVSSGLLMRSLGRLFQVARGFDSSALLTMQVQLTGQRFRQDTAASRFYLQALEAVRAVPGVDAAGFTSQLPLSGDRDEYGAHFRAADGLPGDTYGAFRYAVSPGYLETLRIPLLRGRMLDDHDTASAPGAALISQSLAEARFPGRSPIGAHLTVGGSRDFVIVGVVGNVKQASLAAPDANAIYINQEQSWFVDPVVSFVVRSHGDAATLAAPVRAAVWSVDANQPIVRVATMAELLDRSEAQRRFALTVFTAFAAAGLLLAAVGIYGVLAWSVSTRAREIGVRAALGATRGALVALVVRDGMTLTGAGIAAGLAGAAFATRALLTLLFGVSRLDPVTYLAVVALLSAVAGLACWIPAARAARVDPVTALRGD